MTNDVVEMFGVLLVAVGVYFKDPPSSLIVLGIGIVLCSIAVRRRAQRHDR